MRYRSLDQIAAEAEVHPVAEPSRRERLERWAEALERCGARRLRAIPDIEYGPKWEREARRIDNSPLSVAFADPELRAAGLKGDTIGDAAEFFDLSLGRIHRLACVCCHGRTIDAHAMAGELRGLARREGLGSLAVPAAGLAAGGAVLVGVAIAAGLF